uniref:Uncharacterized protein n=1 Tax=Arundo donax TaxID=35708 RepID=A0A0A9B3I2_ARUDO
MTGSAHQSRDFLLFAKKQRHFIKPVESDFIPISALLHWAASLRRSGGWCSDRPST